MKTYFPSVTEKPSDFESDICKAAKEGKLASIRYLVEQRHANVEVKDKYGCTPINYASASGSIDIIKYLYETCHEDVETKDDGRNTPINNASKEGHLEVVKYLKHVMQMLQKKQSIYLEMKKSKTTFHCMFIDSSLFLNSACSLNYWNL